jgi:hypothetical protein
LCFGLFGLTRLLARVNAFLGFKVIAKIGALLVADLFGNRFAAMLGLAQVIKLAQFTRMQIGVALFADVAPGQRQR